jgi:hypothetical protein
MGPLSVYTLEDQQSRVWKDLGLRECVIDSFRHNVRYPLGRGGGGPFHDHARNGAQQGYRESEVCPSDTGDDGANL